MKVILQFDLPAEKSEHTVAIHAGEMHSALIELDEWLRSEIKYNGRNELQEVRDRLLEIEQDNGVDGLIDW
jgi:hypothetical protein